MLSDAEKRSMYDRYGHSAFERGAGGGSVDFSNFVGLSIEDLFESFFGTPVARGARQRVQRGQDLRYDMHLTLEEAVFGTSKEISLTKHATLRALHRQRHGARQPADEVHPLRRQRRDPPHAAVDLRPVRQRHAVRPLPGRGPDHLRPVHRVPGSRRGARQADRRRRRARRAPTKASRCA